MKRPIVFVTICYVLIIIAANKFGLYNNNAFDSYDGEVVTAKGIVTETYTTDYGYQLITLDANDVNGEKYNKKISALFTEPQNILPGQSAEIKGVAQKPSFKRNPGGISERRYMLTRGYGGKLDKSVLKPGEVSNYYIYYTKKISERLSGYYSNYLPQEMSGFMKAMTIGVTTNIDENVYDNFRKTGTAHILSISGLHISAITLALFWLVKKVSANIKIASVITLSIVVLYSAFTGASTATTRAAIMAAVVLFGYIIERTPDTYTSVALAALVILIKEPLFLFDQGFLFSFFAVTGLIVLTGPIEHCMAHIINKRLSRYLASGMAATLSVMPITAYFYGYVPAVGMFAGAFIMPLFGILTIAGFMFLFLGSTVAAPVLSSVFYVIIKFYFWVTEFFANVPFAVLVTGQPALYNIIIYYIIMAIAALLYYYPHHKRYMCGAIVFVLAAAASINVYYRQNTEQLKIAFLDVGQGDSAVIHLPGNINIMIDGGGSLLKQTGADTGKKVVYPYLCTEGVRMLNAVFLTHPDIDHAHGVIEIMELVKVGRLFVPDCDLSNDAVMAKVLSVAAENGVPVSKIRTGYKAGIGETLIECIYPVYRGVPDSVNNASLVLKITYRDSSFLFTGDIDVYDEYRILSDSAYVKSDVLKIAHHGSNSSTAERFLQEVSPDFAIVGAGRNNTFGHPSKEVLERFSARDIPVYSTADNGAVLISADGEKIIITTMAGIGE